jgi:hypothetical protein
MADTQSFSNIDGAKWSRIQVAVKAKAGIDISSDFGVASSKGITISWNYVAPTETLVIKLVKRSFYDPSSDTIDTDIAQWIEAA